ncbi:uncharacterized protein V1516DRAFT_678977 [Lipomyces oligophaga]|uniref:uncharacterized protein n=1 Tax=Lipomyces oligophaga TaxID=45792 RepID=UPI0034CD5A3D
MVPRRRGRTASTAATANFVSAHLSTIDDFLTSVIVDSLYFWSHVHKVHPARRTPRGPNVRAIINIIQTSSPEELLPRFLALPQIRSYIAGHTTTTQLAFKKRLQIEFASHAKRYLDIYSRSCPFEVATTERYRRVSKRSEACVLARTRIPADTRVPYLVGKMVILGADDENELFSEGDEDSSQDELRTRDNQADYQSSGFSARDRKRLKRDFSIIYSHRLGHACLMLGPARFVNHDCKPNAKFEAPAATASTNTSHFGANLDNSNSVALVSLTDIEPGQEITVSYADNYFGLKNRECLCATCERRGTGFFGKKRKRRHHRRQVQRSESSTSTSSNSSNQTDDQADITPDTSMDEDLTDSESEISYSSDIDSDVQSITRSTFPKTRARKRLQLVRREQESQERMTKLIQQHRESQRLLQLKEQQLQRDLQISKFGHKLENGRRRSTRQVVRTKPKDYEEVVKSLSERDIGYNNVIGKDRDNGSDVEEKRGKGEGQDEFINSWNSVNALMYNAYWGSEQSTAESRHSNTRIENPLVPSNTPSFEIRKCQNTECNSQFLLGLNERADRLQKSCQLYVDRYSRIQTPLVCCRCNRHAAIYNLPWPYVDATVKVESVKKIGKRCVRIEEEHAIKRVGYVEL